jgi:hypothetical protein
MSNRIVPRDRVDEMGEASFPASDPPAVWTWDISGETADDRRNRSDPAAADSPAPPLSASY